MSSLFPDIDKEIEEIVAAEKKLEKEILEKIKRDGEKYRPSCGTDGMVLEDFLCQGCSKKNYEKEIWCNTWDMLYHDYVDEIIEYKGNVICLNHSNFNINEYIK